jgi:hypothetical protein
VALISDVVQDGPRERPFTVVSMIRGACFALGGLIAGLLVTSTGAAGYRIALAADAASFVASALLLGMCIRLPRPPLPEMAGGRAMARPGTGVLAARTVLRNRPFLALVGCAGLVVLSMDFFLAGTPVYVLQELHGPARLPGLIVAELSVLATAGGAAVLRMTRGRSRIGVMRLGAVLSVTWCAASLGAALLPASWRPADLLVATVALAASVLLFEPRALALVEAATPPSARGRYLAMFQYAFAAASVVAPAVVGLYAVAMWLPWLLVAAGAGAAIPVLGFIGRRLPANVIQPPLEAPASTGSRTASVTGAAGPG